MHESQRHVFTEVGRRGATWQATVCTFIQVTLGFIVLKLNKFVSKPAALIRVVLSALSYYSSLLSLSPYFLKFSFFLFLVFKASVYAHSKLWFLFCYKRVW